MGGLITSATTFGSLSVRFHALDILSLRPKSLRVFAAVSIGSEVCATDFSPCLSLPHVEMVCNGYGKLQMRGPYEGPMVSSLQQLASSRY